MKEMLGWVVFFLALVLSIGLIGSMIGGAWYEYGSKSALIGFFGFGIPVLLTGGGTLSLWSNSESLLKIYGIVSSILGLICAICLIICVASWILPEVRNEPAWGYFFGFGIPMLVYGGVGIFIIQERTY
jgi:hypothetical protein